MTKQSAPDKIEFSVNINVSMAEFTQWSPERIAAFFEGVAQVLTAQGSSRWDTPRPEKKQ